MEKYIKLNGQKIIEVKPLDTLELFTDDEFLAQFEKEFIKADVPENVKDIELMQNYIYKDGTFEKTSIFKDRLALQFELVDIETWLSQNDWKVNKISLGEWEANDPRYIEYINERKAKRQRFDEIKELLGE